MPTDRERSAHGWKSAPVFNAAFRIKSQNNQRLNVSGESGDLPVDKPSPAAG